MREKLPNDFFDVKLQPVCSICGAMVFFKHQSDGFSTQISSVFGASICIPCVTDAFSTINGIVSNRKGSKFQQL